MYRNSYDREATTYSPAGRIHQVEYACCAVEQGGAAVGLRSNEFVVLGSLKRAPAKAASHQKKIFKVDDHMGIAVSGLISDARLLRRYMINECLNHQYVFETPMQVGRLVRQVADKAQYFTQNHERRPYGVGLLVGGYDKTGPHLYQTDPSGNYYEFLGQAMGARSQAARTYLEKHFESFADCSLDELIKHALLSLKGTAQDGKVNSKNASIAFVGRGTPLTVLDDDAVRPYVVAAYGDDQDEDEAKEGGDDDDEDDDEDGGEGKKKKKKKKKEEGGAAEGGDGDSGLRGPDGAKAMVLEEE